MKTWRKIRLGDACKTNMYSYSPKENWNFVNYLDTGNITDNKIDSIQYIDIVNEKLPSRARRKVKKDSIIYSTVRPNQHHFGIIKSQPENFLVSTGFAVIDTDSKVLDADFLYYLLTQSTVVESLHAIAEQSTSAYPSIKPSDIENLEIEIPDIATQKKIADVLFSLDKKIAQNMEINKNLEEQIRILCNAWLNDYVPFGGICPSNWLLTPLSSFAKFISGYSYKGTELQESSVAMATIKNFDRKGGFKLDGYKEIVPSSKLKPEHHAELFDTLVAHTDLTQNAEVIGNAEPVLSFSGYEDIIFSMDVVRVLPEKPTISKFLIAAMLKTQQFKTHCLGYVNGTTVLHLSKKALPEYSLMLPEDFTVLHPLDEAVSSMYKQMALNIDETVQLTNLRDALLPQLMSGEIDVSNLDL
ncbi:MAG: restriction endonuclease subunit S [Lactobacillus iners]|nr:restriction endonuclease subunit S [Lactobacillus iners]MDK8757418.1 restriction endonuclease subunit S [Lactobacillus iners]